VLSAAEEPVTKPAADTRSEYEAVMRRLLGDPQRLAQVQLNVQSRHIGDLAPHPFKVCNAPLSRRLARMQIRSCANSDFFPQNAENGVLLSRGKVRSFCPAVSIVVLLATAREKQVQSFSR
jgi:hypothetical protein